MLACVPPMSRTLRDVRHRQATGFFPEFSDQGRSSHLQSQVTTGSYFRSPSQPARGSARRAGTPPPLTANMLAPCCLVSISKCQKRRGTRAPAPAHPAQAAPAAR
jgi:hypothetical protein